jgi:hypothetical protein
MSRKVVPKTYKGKLKAQYWIVAELFVHSHHLTLQKLCCGLKAGERWRWVQRSESCGTVLTKESEHDVD